jgi:hypothetical protein
LNISFRKKEDDGVIIKDLRVVKKLGDDHALVLEAKLLKGSSILAVSINLTEEHVVLLVSDTDAFRGCSPILEIFH